MEKYCSNCGAEVKGKFCENCGQSVSDDNISNVQNTIEQKQTYT